MAIETAQLPEHAAKAPEQTNTDHLAFDPVELQKKYDVERNIRLRNGGVSQYRSAWKSGLGSYLVDPNADPHFSRDPISARYDVAVMGGGFGGLLVAARLLQRGITNITIIEKGADFGGTWYTSTKFGLLWASADKVQVLESLSRCSV